MKNLKQDLYQKRSESIRYLINEDVCKVCGACFKVCPHNAITGEKKKFYAIIDTRCRKCGLCKEACRYDAIGFLKAPIEILEQEEVIDMEEEEKDFYERLRGNISNWANTEKGRKYTWTRYLLIAPDLFHVLCKCILDERVPILEKTKLSLAVAYFITPLDLFPEAIMGPVGYIDDVALAAYTLSILVNNIDPHIISRHWAGDEDILVTVGRILADAEAMITSGMWKKLSKAFR